MKKEKKTNDKKFAFASVGSWETITKEKPKDRYYWTWEDFDAQEILLWDGKTIKKANIKDF